MSRGGGGGGSGSGSGSGSGCGGGGGGGASSAMGGSTLGGGIRFYTPIKYVSPATPPETYFSCMALLFGDTSFPSTSVGISDINIADKAKLEAVMQMLADTQRSSMSTNKRDVSLEIDATVFYIHIPKKFRVYFIMLKKVYSFYQWTSNLIQYLAENEASLASGSGSHRNKKFARSDEAKIVAATLLGYLNACIDPRYPMQSDSDPRMDLTNSLDVFSFTRSFTGKEQMALLNISSTVDLSTIRGSSTSFQMPSIHGEMERRLQEKRRVEEEQLAKKREAKLLRERERELAKKERERVKEEKRLERERIREQNRLERERAKEAARLEREALKAQKALVSQRKNPPKSKPLVSASDDDDDDNSTIQRQQSTAADRAAAAAFFDDQAGHSGEEEGDEDDEGDDGHPADEDLGIDYDMPDDDDVGPIIPRAFDDDEAEEDNSHDNDADEVLDDDDDDDDNDEGDGRETGDSEGHAVEVLGQEDAGDADADTDANPHPPIAPAAIPDDSDRIGNSSAYYPVSLYHKMIKECPSARGNPLMFFDARATITPEILAAFNASDLTFLLQDNDPVESVFYEGVFYPDRIPSAYVMYNLSKNNFSFRSLFPDVNLPRTISMDAIRKSNPEIADAVSAMDLTDSEYYDAVLKRTVLHDGIIIPDVQNKSMYPYTDDNRDQLLDYIKYSVERIKAELVRPDKTAISVREVYLDEIMSTLASMLTPATTESTPYICTKLAKIITDGCHRFGIGFVPASERPTSVMGAYTWIYSQFDKAGVSIFHVQGIICMITRLAGLLTDTGSKHPLFVGGPGIGKTHFITRCIAIINCVLGIPSTSKHAFEDPRARLAFSFLQVYVDEFGPTFVRNLSPGMMKLLMGISCDSNRLVHGGYGSDRHEAQSHIPVGMNFLFTSNYSMDSWARGVEREDGAGGHMTSEFQSALMDRIIAYLFARFKSSSTAPCGDNADINRRNAANSALISLSLEQLTYVQSIASYICLLILQKLLPMPGTYVFNSVFTKIATAFHNLTGHDIGLNPSSSRTKIFAVNASVACFVLETVIESVVFGDGRAKDVDARHTLERVYDTLVVSHVEIRHVVLATSMIMYSKLSGDVTTSEAFALLDRIPISALVVDQNRPAVLKEEHLYEMEPNAPDRTRLCQELRSLGTEHSDKNDDGIRFQSGRVSTRKVTFDGKSKQYTVSWAYLKSGVCPGCSFLDDCAIQSIVIMHKASLLRFHKIGDATPELQIVAGLMNSDNSIKELIDLERTLFESDLGSAKQLEELFGNDMPAASASEFSGNITANVHADIVVSLRDFLAVFKHVIAHRPQEVAASQEDVLVFIKKRCWLDCIDIVGQPLVTILDLSDDFLENIETSDFDVKIRATYYNKFIRRETNQAVSALTVALQDYPGEYMTCIPSSLDMRLFHTVTIAARKLAPAGEMTDVVAGIDGRESMYAFTSKDIPTTFTLLRLSTYFGYRFPADVKRADALALEAYNASSLESKVRQNTALYNRPLADFKLRPVVPTVILPSSKLRECIQMSIVDQPPAPSSSAKRDGAKKRPLGHVTFDEDMDAEAGYDDDDDDAASDADDGVLREEEKKRKRLNAENFNLFFKH